MYSIKGDPNLKQGKVDCCYWIEMRVKEVLTSSPNDLFVCFLKGTNQLVEVLCHKILKL